MVGFVGFDGLGKAPLLFWNESGWGGYKNLESGMTPVLKETYIVIDEWWRKYGYAPSISEIMFVTGEKGRGNVARKMRALIDLGICKGIPRRPRSIRPAYLRVRNIE